MTTGITHTMILAAGFGKRLRPITDTTPKPLVKVGGRTMLDRALDAAVAAGITKAVVNVHYLGEQIIEHCAGRTDPAIAISDERAEILDTGGGIVSALPLLGEAPFLLINADTFWTEPKGETVLSGMIAGFDPPRMDMALLVVAPEQTTGHSGGIDFHLGADGRLARAPKGADTGYIYAGAAIIAPHVFSDAPDGPHSLNLQFDAAIRAGHLFGHAITGGHWYTVGTPAGLEEAEAHLAANGG